MPSFSACFLSSGVRAAPPRGKSTSSRGLKVDETSVGTCWIWSNFRFFCPFLSEPGAAALSESLPSDDFRFAEALAASRPISILREMAFFWASGILALCPTAARKLCDRHERKKVFLSVNLQGKAGFGGRKARGSKVQIEGKLTAHNRLCCRSHDFF